MTTPVTAEPPHFRHPLGLPAGSIRAVLTLMIAVLFWLLLLLPPERPARVPPYLYVLLSMVLLFITAHGKSIGWPGEPSPWRLPRGFFRVLLILGFIAVIGWQYFNNLELLLQRLTPTQEDWKWWPYFLLVLGGGFGLGRLMRLAPWGNAPWYQDLLAWVSLLAMLGLIISAVIEVFIKPNLDPNVYADLQLPLWEGILVAIIAYYFGARS